MRADKSIPYALVESPIPFRLGDVAPSHGMVMVTCAGCGNTIAHPRGEPLICPLGCKCIGKVA